MSLALSLRNAIRTRVPDEIMAKVSSNDKQMMENVIAVLCEYVISIDISRMTIERNKDTYTVCIPIDKPIELSLADLREVENYNPARVLDMRVCVSAGVGTSAIRLCVADENRKVMVSECDVVRIRKRRRWWEWK